MIFGPATDGDRILDSGVGFFWTLWEVGCGPVGQHHFFWIRWIPLGRLAQICPESLTPHIVYMPIYVHIISTHIRTYIYIYNIISTDIASWCTPVDFVGSWEIWLQGCWRLELRRILGIAVAPRPCTMQLRTAVRRQPRSYWMWELKEMLQELMVPLRCMLLPFTDDWSRICKEHICKEHLLCTSLIIFAQCSCSNVFQQSDVFMFL